MKLSKRINREFLIIDINEDISMENAHELDEYIQKSINSALNKVVLNIQAVNYVNSFALGVLIKTMQTIEKKGHEFYLMNVTPSVKTLFKVTGLSDKFKIYSE